MEIQPPQYVQQPTIVMVPPQATTDQFKQSSISQMKVMSILQVVIGCLCIVFGATVTGLMKGIFTVHGEYIFTLAGATGCGIWIGIYFIIVGGVGIGAVKTNSSCWITSALVLNVICSALWCTVLFYMSVSGISAVSISGGLRDYSSGNKLVTAYLALHSLLLLLMVAEFIITIWSAVLCCGAVCRCCKPSQMRPQYYPTQQPMMYGGGPGVVAYQAGQQYMYPMGVQPSAPVEAYAPPGY